MLFQYILGESGIEALAYVQNSPFVVMLYVGAVRSTSLSEADARELCLDVYGGRCVHDV